MIEGIANHHSNCLPFVNELIATKFSKTESSLNGYWLRIYDVRSNVLRQVTAKASGNQEVWQLLEKIVLLVVPYQIY